MVHTEATERLGIDYPIIQAPMAGGVTTSRLVASVSNHGGLGMIGAGYMSPEQLRTQIQEVKKLTEKNFGVNLFVPKPFRINPSEIEVAKQVMQPIMKQLDMEENLVEVPSAEQFLHTFREQIQVVIDEGVPVCSFVFGIPEEELIAELKGHQTILMGTATTVSEAIAIEKSGMDMIVAQGSEAGGHRGAFMRDASKSMIGLMSLLPQVVDHVSLPVIAAGGIMDGRGLMASLCLGAVGVQMGTAFLMCAESGTHPAHKAAILKAEEDTLVLTRTFSGKWARGILNTFIQEMDVHESVLPEFPIQNSLTQPLRRAAKAQNKPDFMSLWSGQSPRLAKQQTVQALIEQVVEEAKRVRSRFH